MTAPAHPPFGRRLAVKLIAVNIIVLFIPITALYAYREWHLPAVGEEIALAHLEDWLPVASRGVQDMAPSETLRFARLPDSGTATGKDLDLNLLRALRESGALRPGRVDVDPNRIALVDRVDGVWVMVSEDRARAVPALFPHHQRIAVVIELTLIVAIILSAVLSWSILAPLDRLRSRAENAAAGRMPGPEPVRGEDEVGDLARALDALLLRMSEQFETLRTYAAESSHRMRTSLAAIKGAAEMLGDARLDPAIRTRFAKHILNEVQRMERALRETLTLARLEGGGGPARTADFPVVARIAEVCDSFAAVVPAVKIEVTTQDPAMRVVADAERVEEAAAALIENAIKFAGPVGRVRVTIETADQGWRLVVEDSGPGIASENESRIFDRFFTTGEPAPDGSGATGLGLPIARAIARLHGGDIFSGRSELGGARFAMEMPAG